MGADAAHATDFVDLFAGSASSFWPKEEAPDEEKAVGRAGVFILCRDSALFVSCVWRERRRVRRRVDPSDLRRHLENLENALAAMIELWRSGQAWCIDASDLRALERVRDDLL